MGVERVDRVGSRERFLAQQEEHGRYGQDAHDGDRMALVADANVTLSRTRVRRCAPILGAALAVALAAGCTGGATEDTGASSEPRSGFPSSPRSLAAEEETQGDRVERVLRTGERSTSDDPFVAAGLERVTEGIHSYATVPDGTPFTLSVACSGSGKVRITVGLGPPRERLAECDGVPVTQRVEQPDEPVKVDVDALPGATGMVGWRIDEQPAA
ncbi:hypothetical protein [Streptomyces californicus]|uniref:hypothetical protein n=1 Tax=Streptomyces californicus TaxID=67351 RepID=UPI003795E93E